MILFLAALQGYEITLEEAEEEEKVSATHFGAVSCVSFN